MTDLRLSVLVEAIDQLTAPFRRMTEVVGGPAREARRAFGEALEPLKQFGESYAGLAASIGAGLELRELVNDEDVFARIGIDADVSTERVDKLKDHLYDAARQWGVAESELQGGFAEMFGLVGLDQAEKGIDALAMTIQRLGGKDVGPAIGALFADLEKFGNLKGPDDLIKGMAILREQVGPHADWLADLARVAPELLNAYKMQGSTGLNALRDIGALYTALRGASPNPRMAGTAAMGVLEAVYNPAIAAGLSGLNIQALGRTPEERQANLLSMQRRPLPEWMPQLVEALRQPGLGLELDQLLPGVRQALFNLDPADFKARLQVLGDARKYEDEATEGAHTLASSLRSIGDSMTQLADDWLSSPLRFVADTLGAYPKLVGGAVTALGGFAIFGLVAGWVGQGWEALKGFLAVTSMAPAAIADFTLALRAGYGAFEALSLAFAANPLGVVLTAIGLVTVASIELYEHWDEIVKLWHEAADWWRRVREGSQPTSDSQQYDIGGMPVDGAMMWPLGKGPSTPASPQRSESSVTVRFENAPPGMRVRQTRTDGRTSLDTVIERGYAVSVP